MANALPSFAKFDIHSDEHSVGIRWIKYVQKLENMFVGMSVESKKRKKALLLHYAGDEVFDIHDTLPDTGGESDYDQTKRALELYFKPQVNKEFEIFEFRQFKQTESETVDQFATRLRQKANNCEFGNTEGEIKSQIIQGCTSTPLRRKALKDSMDLSALLLSARTMEIANRQADKIGSDLGHEKINVVRKKSTKPVFPRQPERQQPRFFGAKPPRPASTPTSVCRSCGGLYPHQHGCPAYGKTCNYCKKPNHFVSQCLRRKRRNRKITQIGNTEIGNTESENEAESGQEEDYSFGVNANNVNTKRSAPKTTVKINDYETKVLVDTGSSLNILDESVYMKMQDKPKLSKPDTKAFAYGQKQQLPIKGKFQAKIETDTKITTGNFYVISGNYGSLLSYNTAVDLNIVPAINSVDTPKTYQLVGEYSDLFHGLGKLNDKVIKLHIDESVAPVALPHRRIPFHIRKQVEKELDRLESTDIIEKVVEGATPWCSPIVVAPKPKSPDEIRICVDMRKANQAIGRERHITPTIDDLITELNGAKVFSTIDLKNGFHQIELAPESRSITTFSTHVGLYRYKRLNMGVTSAPEIFQNEVRQVLEGLHGVRNISDDIIVYGKNQAEHDRNLEAVFGRLRENNLTLNKQKCKFSQPKLVFFGYVFSESGLSADPSKVDAIKHADTPSTPSEVRSYLGMTNYVSRFIPNYSTITEPLRRLTRESEPWVWTDSQQNAFETLKNTLSSDTVIAYFDPSKETELWTDASPVGLSAIMTQENRIIGYASKALSPVEQRYSQVERECLGIVWGIEHFHLYLFGHTFNLITDHCPLVAIFNTPKAKQPLRLERWRLRLATYDFKVVYRAGKNNIADYMSRHPHASASDTEMSLADDYVSYIAHNAVPKSMTIKDISRETQTDETMLKVIRSVKSNRWDKSECQSNKTYNSYARLSDELTVVEIEGKNVLLRGTKLAVPSSLQQKVIDLAHEGHQGIVRTKALLREKVWFPCIDDLVDKTCKSCIPCIAVTPTSTSEPVKMSELPSRPWDEVSIDFFGPIPSGDYIMVILDDYTRFPVLEILTSTSSKAVIPRLDNVFSTMGVPSIVKTDNGPPFNGHEFSQFAEYLGFRHRKITPLHPIANGHAERFMQPLAKCIKTAKIEGKNYKQELNKFLRNYRSTPHQTTKISPAEALFSRKMKTTLPQFDTPLNDESIRRKDGEMKQKAKMYTDIKRSANESQLSHGDYILVKQQKKNKLSSYYNPEPGTVLEKKGSMVTVRVGDRTVTRDASHFRRLPLSTRGGINYGGPSDPGPPDIRLPGGNRRSDETEMVMADLERANERSTAAERDTEKLRQQLTALTSSLGEGRVGQQAGDMDQAIDVLQRTSLEVELAAKEKEIAQLVEDVRRLQASLHKLRENTAHHVGRLEEELSSKSKAFKILEEKVNSQDDYEEIKRELCVLKSIEFSSTSPADEVDGDRPKSLEMLLLEKNKAIQSANTQLKVNTNDLSDTSSPALSTNAEAFVSVLGQEIAASYLNNNNNNNNYNSFSGKKLSSSPQKTGQSPPAYSEISPKRDTNKTHSPESADIPPQVPSSPHSDLSRHGRPPSRDVLHLPPPPSPQFFPPGYSHMMANFMGMNAANVKSEINGVQGLDTALVAKTIRELLSIHNIGQRLFAKHVLGLSQGTVSELLSKPKSWDKLTEKGRESYRKMHHWSVDERNVLALKAISPRKGTQPLLPTIQRDDSETEQRIASILNDAQMAMQNKKQMEQHQSTMVSNIYQQMAQFNQMHGRHPITSPTSSHPVHTLHNGWERERHHKVSEIDRHREKHDVSEASAKEMVERIYRQELIKLAQSAQNAGNIAASTLYQQELARLAHCPPVKEEPEPGELPRRHTSPEMLNVKSEPPDSTSDELMAQFNNGPIDLSKHSCSSTPSTPNSAGSDKSLNNSAHHSGSAFFVVRPKVNGHDAVETGSDNHPPMAPQAHVAFPPNPQEGSSNMSTVSPLQRMQNIANSLMSQSQITTPVNKPLRAVLPPITQEEFDQYSNVNTDDLVKQVKETLSQYSISQRLFGESVLGLSQGSVSDLLARPKPWHMLTQKGREPFIRMQLFLEDAEAIPKLVATQYHISPDKLMRSNSFGREQIPPSTDKPPRIPNFPLVFPGVPPVPMLDQRHLLHPFHTQPPPSQCASFSYPSSMLEVVAMTSEIDTLELTSRVKDVLQFNNLGQKLFGETVLGLSQGSVSELLSKPKPWHMLSIKGREPFIKMHLWLSDQHNVERLKHCQNEIKASRRRRHSLDDRYDSTMSLPKRPRVFFSEEQKERLRQAYNRDPYPNQNTIEALANSLSVGVKTVINWFHNHRMRAKQQQHATSPNTPYPDFPASDNSGKLENSDENSNSSALSSLSGENKEKGHNPGNYLAGFPLGFPGSVGNTSQWMFPQFEPVPLMRRNESRRNSEDNNYENDTNLGNPDDNDIEENHNDIDDGDLSSSDSTKDNSANAKENDDNEFDRENTSDENSENDNVMEDKYLNTESPTERIDKESEFSASGQFLAFPHSGANKRKRSNPQYVSAGRHLDRTTNRLTNAPLKSLLDIDVEVDVEKENEGGNSEDSFSSNNFDSNLERLKKTMEFNEGGWNENGERSTSINKMHKSITHSSREDWEF